MKRNCSTCSSRAKAPYYELSHLLFRLHILPHCKTTSTLAVVIICDDRNRTRLLAAPSEDICVGAVCCA